MKLDDIIKDEKLRGYFLDPKIRSYAIISVAGFFFFISMFLIIAPSLRELSVKGEELNRLEKEISVARREISRLPELEAELEALKLEYSEYADQIPSRKEIGDFLESLAQTAGESDVRLLSVTPVDSVRTSGEKSSEHFGRMMVSISAKGGYHQINRFVEYLEGGKGFSFVRDIRIQHDPRNPLRHDVDIVLNIFVSIKGD